MQKIERYGVIALVVLLVTILAVSLWGEGGWSWKFWEKQDSTSASADAKPLRYGPRGQNNNLDGAQNPLTEPIPTPGTLPISTAVGTVAEPSTGAAPLNNPTNLGGTQPQPPIVGGTPSPAPLGGQPSGSNGVQLPPLAQPGANGNVGPILRPADTLKKEPVVGARQYVVKNGDTLGEIASRELGSAARWTEIQKLNGNLDPNKLRAGMTLNLPAGSRSVAASSGERKDKPKSKVNGGKTYVVKSGDSLSRIAARELGAASRWTEIRDLNPGINPDRLKVGDALTLPATAVARAERKDEVIGWSPAGVTKSAVQ